MQTPAERYLVERLAGLLSPDGRDAPAPALLDVGAGRSIAIEQQLTDANRAFICDRIDIEACDVQFPAVRHCWHGSIDDMKPVPSGTYRAVFANYVLEHVENLPGAAREVFRVLSPGGVFIATLPNTSAPEFRLAKLTPLWFHKLVRRDHGWETHYAYKGIAGLIATFTAAGFTVEEERRWPFVEGYLWKYPIAGPIGRLYDRLISWCRLERFMGNACLVLRKPG